MLKIEDLEFKSHAKKESYFYFILRIMLGVFMGICGTVFAERDKGSVASDTETLPYEGLRTFTEIFWPDKKGLCRARFG